MRPVLPIIPGEDLPTTVYAENQPEYKPLPVWKDSDGTVLSRWKLSWRERLRVLFSGDIYLWVSTFNHPLQPVTLQVDKPQMTGDEKTAAIGALARKMDFTHFKAADKYKEVSIDRRPHPVLSGIVIFFAAISILLAILMKIAGLE